MFIHVLFLRTGKRWQVSGRLRELGAPARTIILLTVQLIVAPGRIWHVASCGSNSPSNKTANGIDLRALNNNIEHSCIVPHPCLITWKATIPFFFGQTALTIFLSLRLWSSGATCVRVATAFYGLFSTKCKKKTVLLRAGLLCSFDLTIHSGHYDQKKLIITAFSHNDQNIVCFWLSR